MYSYVLKIFFEYTLYVHTYQAGIFHCGNWDDSLNFKAIYCSLGVQDNKDDHQFSSKNTPKKDCFFKMFRNFLRIFLSTPKNTKLLIVTPKRYHDHPYHTPMWRVTHTNKAGCRIKPFDSSNNLNKKFIVMWFNFFILILRHFWWGKFDLQISSADGDDDAALMESAFNTTFTGITKPNPGTSGTMQCPICHHLFYECNWRACWNLLCLAYWKQ